MVTFCATAAAGAGMRSRAAFTARMFGSRPASGLSSGGAKRFGSQTPASMASPMDAFVGTKGPSVFTATAAGVPGVTGGAAAGTRPGRHSPSAAAMFGTSTPSPFASSSPLNGKSMPSFAQPDGTSLPNTNNVNNAASTACGVDGASVGGRGVAGDCNGGGVGVGLDCDGNDEDSEGHIRTLHTRPHEPGIRGTGPLVNGTGTHKRSNTTSKLDMSVESDATGFLHRDGPMHVADAITALTIMVDSGQATPMSCLHLCDRVDEWSQQWDKDDWHVFAQRVGTVMENHAHQLHPVSRLLFGIAKGDEVDMDSFIDRVDDSDDVCRIFAPAIEFCAVAVMRLHTDVEIQAAFDRLQAVTAAMNNTAGDSGCGERCSHPSISQTLVVYRAVLAILDASARIGRVDLVEAIARWVRGELALIPTSVRASLDRSLDAAFLDAVARAVSMRNAHDSNGVMDTESSPGQSQSRKQPTYMKPTGSLKRAISRATVLVSDFVEGRASSNNEIVQSIMRFLHATLELHGESSAMSRVSYAWHAFSAMELRCADVGSVSGSSSGIIKFVPELTDYLLLLEIIADPRASMDGMDCTRAQAAYDIINRIVSHEVELKLEAIGHVFDAISTDYVSMMVSLTSKDADDAMKVMIKMDTDVFIITNQLEQVMREHKVVYDVDVIVRAIRAYAHAGMFEHAASRMWDMRRSGITPTEAIYEHYISCVADRAERESVEKDDQLGMDRNLSVDTGLCVGKDAYTGFHGRAGRVFNTRRGLSAARFVLRDLRYTMARDGVAVSATIGTGLLRCSAALRDAESGAAVARAMGAEISGMAVQGQAALRSLAALMRAASAHAQSSS